MRTRSITATGLVILLGVACSEPAADEPQSEPAATESRDLALSPVDDEEPIASELEAPRPAPREHGSSRPAVLRPAVPAPAGQPVASEIEAVAVPHEERGPVMATHPRVDETEAPRRGPYAGEAEGGGKPRIPMTGERVPDPGAGVGGIGVIIRGGAGRDGDDCANHRPPQVGDVRPPSGTGVLINDRTPRRGPPQADRTPAAGPQMGRGIR